VNDADLAIVGLGTVGAMAAWRAADRRGLRTIGFDRFHVGHGRGGAAGESRVFRTAYHEGPDYVPLLLRARELWQELERVSGRDIFLPTGTLSIGAEGSAPLENVLASIAQHDLPHRVLDSAALAARYPQHRVGSGDLGVLDELGGGLRSELALDSAVRAAVAGDVEVRNRSTVTRIEETGSGVEIATADGAVTRVARVIVTAGAWTSELLPQLRSLLVVTPIVLTWFLPVDVRRFQPEVFPTFIRDTDDIHLFGVPSIDGYSVKVSVNERWGTVDTADDVPPRMSDEALAFVGAGVHELLPDLPPEPVRHSVHMDAWAPGRRALVGRLPGAERIVVVAGLSGHGFKLAPVFGGAAVDIALDADGAAAWGAFDPSAAFARAKETV
jgi:sarcosine oxidase